MTARIWTGTVRRADADAYAALYPEDERYLVDGRPTGSKPSNTKGR